MKTYKIASLCTLGLIAMAFTSCSDPDDEVKTITFNRNFAPLDTKASNVQETSATVEWAASTGADSYTLQLFANDSLTFAGTPEKTIENLTMNDCPYTFNGLQFDTKYSVRVKAITKSAPTRDSKWNTGTFFRTDVKQFLKAPAESDITDKTVLLKWTVEPGFDVTSVTVGPVTRNLTDAEKTAGQATVEGLTAETEYTAYLYYDGKQCGKRTFTTTADLTGATLVREGDDLTSIIQSAAPGAILALYSGTYPLNVGSDGLARAVTIDKDITIKGISSVSRPTIQGLFDMTGNASLTIRQVIIDGSINSKNDQVFNYKTDNATPDHLIVEFCDFIGFNTKNKGVLYINKIVDIKEVLFENCVFGNMLCENDMFDVRKGHMGTFTLSKSTIYGSCTKRSMVRFDDASANFPGASAPIVKIDQCTIDGVENENATSNMNGIVYVRYGGTTGHTIEITNNLFTNSPYGAFSKNAMTATPTFFNNVYFNCSNQYFEGVPFTDGTFSIHDESGSNGDDPLYKNAAKGDFTLGNANYKSKSVGDPRWR